MLFVVRYADEPDVRWRALNARNSQEARAQALALSKVDDVEYGAVDPDSGKIAILGRVGGVERRTGTR